MSDASKLMLREDERDHVAFAVAHALAMLEAAPAHWARPEAVVRMTELLERLAPRPERDVREGKAVMALRVARKHITALRGAA